MAVEITDIYWVLAKTKPNQERRAVINVERQGHDCFLPLYRDANLRELPLFPSYLFVLINTTWSFLTSTFGVIGPVMFGGQPAVVPKKLVDELQARQDRDGLILIAAPAVEMTIKPLAVGQDVLITEGSFSGFHGIFKEQLPHQRVQVLLDCLGRETPVTIQRHAVQPR